MTGTFASRAASTTRRALATAAAAGVTSIPARSSIPPMLANAFCMSTSRTAVCSRSISIGSGRADHIYRSAGVQSNDRVFFAFSFGPFIGFWSAFSGSERLGSLVIPGGAMTTEQRLRTMLELRATVLFSTPTYAIRLAEAAQAAGIDLAASDIRITVHAGEPGASVPATRDLIERSFGARCLDHTGMTELGPTGVSCDARHGVHLIESEFVFEVRDDAGAVHSLPETGTIAGELVATNIGRWGSPLIRYRTGDRVGVTRQPCACGSPFAKMLGGIRGRVDDMFTVRGVNLYPFQVEDLVAGPAV